MARSQYLIDALKSIGQPQGQPPGGNLGQQMLADRAAQRFNQPSLPPNGVTMGAPPAYSGDGSVPFDPTQMQRQPRQITGGLPGLARMFAGR